MRDEDGMVRLTGASASARTGRLTRDGPDDASDPGLPIAVSGEFVVNCLVRRIGQNYRETHEGTGHPGKVMVICLGSARSLRQSGHSVRFR
jgi:hypothetical protein